jgi:hypothetical protein
MQFWLYVSQVIQFCLVAYFAHLSINNFAESRVVWLCCTLSDISVVCMYFHFIIVVAY